MIVATVDLVAGEPVVVCVLATAAKGLGLRLPQAKVPWGTPLAVISAILGPSRTGAVGGELAAADDRFDPTNPR